MENDLIVKALRYKQAEVHGRITAYEAQIEQPKHDLAHVNATLRWFTDVEKQRARYVVSHGFFRKGEIADLCAVLLQDGSELTTRAPAEPVMRARDLDATTTTLRNSVAFKVVQALRHAARRKLIVMVEKRKGMCVWAAGPAITLPVAGSPSRGPMWDHSTFSKNRDRLLVPPEAGKGGADVAAKFLEAVLRHHKVKRFLSDDHFSVDGTLVEAWASLKSFRAKNGSDEPPSPGRNGERDFHGEKRANDTHESKTDPEAKLFRKGNSQPAKLYFMGHALIENRHGLVVQANATQATGKAERQAVLAMMIDRQDPGSERRLTLAADKGCDTSDFVADLRQKCVTPHVAAKVMGSAIDGRTTRHESYRVSQRKRKLVEEAFG